MSKYLGIDSSTQSMTGLIIDTANERIAVEDSVVFDAHFQSTYSIENGVLELGKAQVHGVPLMWAEALDLLLSILRDKGVELGQISAIAGSGPAAARRKFARA